MIDICIDLKSYETFENFMEDEESIQFSPDETASFNARGAKILRNLNILPKNHVLRKMTI